MYDLVWYILYPRAVYLSAAVLLVFLHAAVSCRTSFQTNSVVKLLTIAFIVALSAWRLSSRFSYARKRQIKRFYLYKKREKIS